MNNLYLHIDEYQVYTTDLFGCVKYRIEIHSYASMRNEIYFVIKIISNKQKLWAADGYMRIPQDLNYIPRLNYNELKDGIERDIIKTTFPIYIKKYLNKNDLKKRAICMNGV
jgi:hypothetical protein